MLEFFIHEGDLYITGRLKDIIIIRGQNHCPQDIEATIQEAHPSIRPGCCAAFSVDVEGEAEVAAGAMPIEVCHDSFLT